MDKDKDLELYIDAYIQYLKDKKAEDRLFDKGEEEKNQEQLRMAHRSNQRRFEYDYEEDFYEPIYEDDDEY